MRKLLGAFCALILLAPILGANLATPRTAAADQQWISLYQWGKTYRSNYTSGCYDQYGGSSNCYQGTWAESYCVGCSDNMSVYETPQTWVPTIPGNWTGPYYWKQKSGISNLATQDAAVSSDYDSLIDHRVDAAAKTANGDLTILGYAYTYDE